MKKVTETERQKINKNIQRKKDCERNFVGSSELGGRLSCSKPWISGSISSRPARRRCRTWPRWQPRQRPQQPPSSVSKHSSKDFLKPSCQFGSWEEVTVLSMVKLLKSLFVETAVSLLLEYWHHYELARQ